MFPFGSILSNAASADAQQTSEFLPHSLIRLDCRQEEVFRLEIRDESTPAWWRSTARKTSATAKQYTLEIFIVRRFWIDTRSCSQATRCRMQVNSAPPSTHHRSRTATPAMPTTSQKLSRETLKSNNSCTHIQAHRKISMQKVQTLISTQPSHTNLTVLAITTTDTKLATRTWLEMQDDACLLALNCQHTHAFKLQNSKTTALFRLPSATLITNGSAKLDLAELRQSSKPTAKEHQVRKPHRRRAQYPQQELSPSLITDANADPERSTPYDVQCTPWASNSLQQSSQHYSKPALSSKPPSLQASKPPHQPQNEMQKPHRFTAQCPQQELDPPSWPTPIQTPRPMSSCYSKETMSA